MKRVLIEFMDSIRNYVFESGADIAHDERESSEFVDIFLKDRPAKRHPDPNGVLKLTPEELEEFAELFFDNKNVVHRVYYDGNCIVVEWKEPDNNEFGQLYLDEVSAILYLAERFELNGEVR